MAAADDYRVRVGALIREAREARGWSQHELATRTRFAKLTGTTVSRWERGAMMPSPEHFAAVERALGIRLIPDRLQAQGSMRRRTKIAPITDVDAATVERRVADRRQSAL